MLKNFDQKTLIQHIEKITSQLGAGIILPVVYDTAWLARVPDFTNIQQPAFPTALQWLRQNQLPDGSWGTVNPCNAHGNTLSTLSALLALTDWQQPDDSMFIQKGINALNKLAAKLSSEPHETIGFELLLPALVNECTAHNIAISAETLQYYQPYEVMGLEKHNLINKQQEKYGYTHPSAWWFSLEMFGGIAMKDKNKQLGFHDAMLAANGSIASSPAATAYLLAAERYRGRDVPKAYEYLNNLAKQHDYSGMPNVAPIDGFELSFGPNYLIEAGISPTADFLQPAISKLYKIWQQYPDGGVGYSSYFITDPDESANGMRVLLAAGYQNINPKVLTDYFNGRYIENFKGERSPSISANLHVISALRMLPPTTEIKQIINAIVQWLKSKTQKQGAVFVDKWHYSALYPTARAIIALEGIDNLLAQQCVNYLIQSQQADGGWGEYESTTMEETAFAGLALAYWHQQGNPVSLSVLQKTHAYLINNGLFSNRALWIGKVLYCPYWVVATVIAAALYALDKAINLSPLR